MYAVMRTGGKQYKVSPGDVIQVERIEGEPGSVVEFNHVFALRKEALEIGTPLVAGSHVRGTILGHGRDPKVRVLKIKRKKQYRRTRGHRQDFTRVKINEIVTA